MDLETALSKNKKDRLQNRQDEQSSRETIEILAVEGYCSGKLSDGEVARMLNLSIGETDDFLRSRGLFDFEGVEELKLGL